MWLKKAQPRGNWWQGVCNAKENNCYRHAGTSDSNGLRTEKAYKEFLNLLEEEGSYESEEIGLHGDIEYLYYVKFVSGEKDTVSYTKINWPKEDKNYFQNLATAECGVHRICLSIKQD